MDQSSPVASNESQLPEGCRWWTTGDMMMDLRMGWMGVGSQSCVAKAVGGDWNGVGIEKRTGAAMSSSLLERAWGGNGDVAAPFEAARVVDRPGLGSL